MLHTGFTGVEISTPKPTLKELVKVKVTNWYNLGLQLDNDELQAIGCMQQPTRSGWLQA